MRRDARELCFKLVFESLFKGEKNLELMGEMLESDEFNITSEDSDYIRSTYLGIIEKHDFLISEIEKVSKGFSAERIYKTDLTLLLLSLYEIKFIDNIPDVVSVNEALEISKKYGTEKSGSFINGILAKFIGGKNVN